MDLNPSLKELQKLFGDSGLWDLLVAYQITLFDFELFLKTDPKDHELIKKMVHRLKSISLSMGEMKIAEFCHDLENESVDFKPIIEKCLLQVTESRQRLDGQLRLLKLTTGSE